MAKTGTDRKKAQRERDRTQSIKRIEIRLGADAVQALERACAIRGGVRGPYELAEYVATLIEQDRENLAIQIDQLKASGPCGKCGKPLPEGCGGFFKEESDCFHALEYRQLMLTEPPRMRQLTESEIDALMGVM
ncbi:MAG: hypothetical protein ACRCXB_22830 [Aeromonadaceae bacterium]